MAYRVNPLSSFENGLAKIDRPVAQRILEKIDDMATNPETIGHPMGNLPKHLSGLHKLRVGNQRIFFWVDHKKKEITLYFVDKRDHAYEKLFRRK